MSLFIMGFQFMPSGLAIKGQQGLTVQAGKLQHKTTATAVQKNLQDASGTVIDLPWINIKVSLPHVDFGLDALYGLDNDDNSSEISDELKF